MIGLISSARRRSASVGNNSGLGIFTGTETGDVWRFNSANMSLTGSAVNTATGLDTGLVMTKGAVGSPNLTTISGNEAVIFDGTDDRLERNFGSVIAQPGTIMFSADVFSGLNAIIAGGDDTTNRWQASFDSSNRLIAVAGSNTLLSGRSSPIEKSVVTIEYNGPSSKIRVNGIEMATGDLGSAGFDFLSLGATGGTGASGWAGSLYGALIINRLLTTGAGGERDLAERLLGSWGGNTWPAGDWQHIFNGGVLGSNSNGWNGFTWRTRIPASSLTDISGTQVRLGLQAGSTEPVTITKAYIGIESGGNFRYASAPTQMTWDGGSTSTTITSFHQKMTDAATLSINGASDTVVVSLYMNGGTSSDTFRITSTMNGLTTQYKSGVDEAATTGALTGYTAQNAAHPIARLVVA